MRFVRTWKPFPQISTPAKARLETCLEFMATISTTTSPNYEIAYLIYEEDGKLVVVILAGTRENFYQQLKRYIKS